jgi:hypothetical protein
MGDRVTRLACEKWLYYELLIVRFLGMENLAPCVHGVDTFQRAGTVVAYSSKTAGKKRRK